MSNTVFLDEYNSDLNLVIEDCGYGASSLNHPDGFRLLWAGGRATYGVCRGKAYFEVRLEFYKDAACDGQVPEHSHLIRVGWSSASSSFALGEDVCSYGYGAAGMFSNNGNFTNYGQPMLEGDVVGAMLDMESNPVIISFMKNGRHLGTAATIHDLIVGNPKDALFPHIFVKNCKIKINFGQCGAWFPPPVGFKYIEQINVRDRVRGATAPANMSDCEVIMTVGLPGCGKSTWAANVNKAYPDKRYNIIGTDTILQQMRVMYVGKVYAERWQLLIGLATKCFDVLLPLAASKKRNYIIDQTNLYASSRQKKMRLFSGFRRMAVVLQPDDDELRRRSEKRAKQDKKEIPTTGLKEMKANYSLPEMTDNLFDRIEYVELPINAAAALVEKYNRENARHRNT